VQYIAKGLRKQQRNDSDDEKRATKAKQCTVRTAFPDALGVGAKVRLRRRLLLLLLLHCKGEFERRQSENQESYSVKTSNRDAMDVLLRCNVFDVNEQSQSFRLLLRSLYFVTLGLALLSREWK